MSQTVETALHAAKLYTDDQLYRLIRLPARGVVAAAGVLAEINEPFGAVIIDKDEVTLVIPDEAVTDFARRLHGHSTSTTAYRLITLDVELEPTLVGFMARIAAALAAQSVSLLPFAAFSRDHLLVPADQFDKAWAALKTLTGK
jgi:hypothetical protein